MEVGREGWSRERVRQNVKSITRIEWQNGEDGMKLKYRLTDGYQEMVHLEKESNRWRRWEGVREENRKQGMDKKSGGEWEQSVERGNKKKKEEILSIDGQSKFGGKMKEISPAVMCAYVCPWQFVWGHVTENQLRVLKCLLLLNLQQISSFIKRTLQ